MKSRFSSSPSSTYLRQVFVEGMGGKQRSHDVVKPVIIPQDTAVQEVTPEPVTEPTEVIEPVVEIVPEPTPTPVPTVEPTPEPTVEPIKVIPTQNISEKPIRTSNFKSKL